MTPSFKRQKKSEVCKALGKELSKNLDADLDRFWTLVKAKATRPDGTIIPPCETEAMTQAMGDALEDLEHEAGAVRVTALKFYMYSMQHEGEADVDGDELLFQVLLLDRQEGSGEERLDYVAKLFELRFGAERAVRLFENIARKVNGAPAEGV